jgi:hypothetical protein
MIDIAVLHIGYGISHPTKEGNGDAVAKKIKMNAIKLSRRGHHMGDTSGICFWLDHSPGRSG